MTDKSGILHGLLSRLPTTEKGRSFSQIQKEMREGFEEFLKRADEIALNADEVMRELLRKDTENNNLKHEFDVLASLCDVQKRELEEMRQERDHYKTQLGTIEPLIKSLGQQFLGIVNKVDKIDLKNNRGPVSKDMPAFLQDHNKRDH
jgi:hypothetical protein